MSRRRLCLLSLMIVCAGCRLQLGSSLEKTPTAANAWQDLRLAHTGGRTVKTMSFMSQETFHPGVGELTYPELVPQWLSHSRYDFQGRTVYQAARVDHGRVLTWELARDGTFKVTRDGKPYKLLPGMDRSLHLRAMTRLLRPWDAFVEEDVELTLMPPRNANTRLRFQERGGNQDTYTLEIDHVTGLTAAVEFTVHELHLPFLHRDEYSDYRDVGGGIFVAHTIRENVLGAGGLINFHDVTLWAVEVELVNPFAGGELPRFPGPPGVGGSASPMPGSATPAGAGH